MGFMVDKVALGQDFSEYVGVPCQSLFHQLIHNHHHVGLVQQANIGRSTKWTHSVSPHKE
jgi:hypothetical protein